MGQLLNLLSLFSLLLITLALLSLVFYKSRRFRSVALLLAAVGSLILVTFSAPIVSDAIVSSVLRGLSDANEENLEHFDTAIVLGGGTYRSTRTGRTHLGASGDRLLLATHLVQSGHVDTLVFSGGGSDRPEGESEAETDSSIVSSWGVDPARILVETKSSNTIENAEFVLELWPELQDQRVGVITSLLHMERALLAFCYQGVTASPLVAEVHPDASGSFSVLSLLPSVSGLRISSYFLKEQLAVFIYRIKYGEPAC